jgi:transcriptional regulator with XRE-family HTH domain
VWAAEWVAILESLTLRDDLHFLTMLPWRDVLPVRGLLRPVRAWCPASLEEWRNAAQVVYEPLLWSLEAVTVCGRHGRRLQTRCPYDDCVQASPPLGRWARPGHCSHCGRWLVASAAEGRVCTRSLTSDELEWGTWVHDAVGEILSAAPGLKAQASRKTLSDGLTKLIREFGGSSLNALAKRLGLSWRSLRDIRDGVQLPTLVTLLRLCAFFGVAPVDLITTGAAVTSRADGLPQVVAKSEPVRRGARRRVDLEALTKALAYELRSMEKPPVWMAAVARRLGYDHAYLLGRFPGLCRTISARYDAFRASQKATRSWRIHRQVHEATLALHQQGRYPSNRMVKAMLPKRSLMREPAGFAAWHEALAHLGC